MSHGLNQVTPGGGEMHPVAAHGDVIDGGGVGVVRAAAWLSRVF